MPLTHENCIPKIVGHLLLQAPQLLGSDESLASHPSPAKPLQLANPGAHVIAQVPLLHTGEAFGPPWQRTPHAPQLLGSSISCVWGIHVPLQLTVPVGHVVWPWHTLFTQDPLMHWLAVLQADPLGNRGWQVPLLHKPLAQSLDTKQILLSAQRGQVEPPQSTSVSLPFLTLSVHEAVAAH